jgi:hypothetical protein
MSPSSLVGIAAGYELDDRGVLVMVANICATLSCRRSNQSHGAFRWKPRCEESLHKLLQVQKRSATNWMPRAFQIFIMNATISAQVTRTIMMTCFRILRGGILIVQSAKYRIAMPQLDSVMFLITATATFCMVPVMYVVDRPLWTQEL